MEGWPKEAEFGVGAAGQGHRDRRPWEPPPCCQVSLAGGCTQPSLHTAGLPSAAWGSGGPHQHVAVFRPLS